MTYPTGPARMYPAYPAYPATPDQMMLQMQAQSAYDDVKKSAGIAYAFWWFLGGVGGHRFHMGQIGLGFLAV
jgi:hypothetical protein